MNSLPVSEPVRHAYFFSVPTICTNKFRLTPPRKKKVSFDISSFIPNPPWLEHLYHSSSEEIQGPLIPHGRPPLCKLKHIKR
jgi:hypothetical protein